MGREGSGTSGVGVLRRRCSGAIELLAASASSDGEGTAAARAAWDAVAGRAGAGLDRPVLAEVVDRVLDDLRAQGRLAPGPDVGVSLPVEVYPAGHRWERWRSDDPQPWPAGARPSRHQVVQALRRLPLAQRVLLVLRDGAHLPPAELADAAGLSAEQQAALLDGARAAFVASLDLEVGRT